MYCLIGCCSYFFVAFPLSTPNPHSSDVIFCSVESTKKPFKILRSCPFFPQRKLLLDSFFLSVAWYFDGELHKRIQRLIHIPVDQFEFKRCKLWRVVLLLLHLIPIPVPSDFNPMSMPTIRLAHNWSEFCWMPELWKCSWRKHTKPVNGHNKNNRKKYICNCFDDWHTNHVHITTADVVAAIIVFAAAAGAAAVFFCFLPLKLIYASCVEWNSMKLSVTHWITFYIAHFLFVLFDYAVDMTGNSFTRYVMDKTVNTPITNSNN